MRRQCPRLVGGPAQQRSQSMTSATVSSPPAQPARGGAQSARGRPRGGGRSGGGQAYFYALSARPNAIASDAVITGIFSVCHRDASILFDPGSTYSYVFSYFAHYLDMPCESLASSVYLSTPVGDTIIVDHYDDTHLLVLKDMVQHGDAKEVTIEDDDSLRMHGNLCVPNVDGLRELIL
ncbi:uncharacterized protein [Nicotiana tomentosiformis]|uniref:uncharacterized protein n=1 Tax=Nicotiana tomentosiformis TaxID=4098 RepID=UPI00388CAFF1